jgi:ribA/ribD-fused uncharacterized protein
MLAIEDFRQSDYRFLMNSFDSPIECDDGHIYPTVEHAFQAAKTTDDLEKEQIRYALSARQAKRIGRSITLRYNWDNERVTVMEELLRKKFEDDTLKGQLLATKSSELVSGGDTFWGQVHGSGENNLGKLLMKIRAEVIKDNLDKLHAAARGFLGDMGWTLVASDDDVLGECWAPSWNPDCHFDLDSAVLHQLKVSQKALDAVDTSADDGNTVRVGSVHSSLL